MVSHVPCTWVQYAAASCGRACFSCTQRDHTCATCSCHASVEDCAFKVLSKAACQQSHVLPWPVLCPASSAWALC